MSTPLMKGGGFVPLRNEDSQSKDVSLKKKPKPFDDGPQLPPSPNPENGLEKSDLYIPSYQVDNCTFGSVVNTNNEVLRAFAKNVQRLNSKTTVAIVEKGCKPTYEEYLEGQHFWSEKKPVKGSFGSGALCKDKISGKEFFLKTIALKDFRSSEVLVPLDLDHKNLTKIFGAIRRNRDDKNPIVELMIEHAGMALNKFRQKGIIEEQMLWNICGQIMTGLSYMHCHWMIHFDIKPENICIEDRGEYCIVKITDFGSAKLPQEPIQFIGWTPEYMCPETCLLFLQKSSGMNGEIKELEISGKVDVFAAALVFMFLHKGAHVLLRMITNGKTCYNDNQERRRLNLDLMKMLVEEPDIIQRVIPDECDIYMRELLGCMTQHDPQQRYSAQDAINFIDSIKDKEREQKKSEASRELFRKQQQQKKYTRDSSSSSPFDCLEKDNGSIKKSTRAAHRKKLKPYPKSKMMKVETDVQSSRKTVNHTEKKAVLTQPTVDVANQCSEPQRDMKQNTFSLMNNKVLPPQKYQPALTTQLEVQRLKQSSHYVDYFVGPKLVQVKQRQTNVIKNRSSVRSYIPASPPDMTHGEMEFPDISVSKREEMDGNMPDLEKLIPFLHTDNNFSSDN